MSMDTGNYQGVGVHGDKIVVLMPKREMTKQEALVHAAWLVALADLGGEEFIKVLEAVEGT